MFKIKADPTFEGVVQIPTPTGAVPLTLVFKHKRRDELKAYFETISKGEMPDGEAMTGIIAGWKDVDAEFSEQALSDLVQEYHGAVQAIYRTYLDELTQAKQGN